MTPFELPLLKTRMSQIRLESYFSIISILVFILSMEFPAFEILTGSGDGTFGGYFLLFVGFTAIIKVGSSESLFFCFAWYANVAFFGAQISLRCHMPFRAFQCAIIALILGGSFSLVKETSTQGMCALNPISLHWGYALWLLSMLLVLVAAGVSITRSARGSSLLQYKGPVIFLVFIGAVYIATGLLLPQGECALLRYI